MESPINPEIWKFLFHGGVAALSFASIFSLYHKRYNVLTSLDADFKAVSAAQTVREGEEAVARIVSKIKGEPTQKRGLTRLAAERHGATLVRLASLNKDGSNADVVRAVVKALVTIFDADTNGHRKLYMLGGYRTLLTTLSEAHRQGLGTLLEETAAALHTLTRVEDSEIILDSDVPLGSEGAYALARMPATVKMLRVLNPQCSIVLLSSLTGVLANVCALRLGVTAVGRGLDGRSGMSYFLRLLEQGNRGVVEHCVLAIYYLVRSGMGHAELAEEENLVRLAENFSLTSDSRSINAVLSILRVMLSSKEASKFFHVIAEKTDVISTIFEIRCRAPEKVLRDCADEVLKLLLAFPECTTKVQRYFERYRSQIAERRAADEQAKQKQLRQNQMMQQMMMMEAMGMEMGSMMGTGM